MKHKHRTNLFGQDDLICHFDAVLVKKVGRREEGGAVVPIAGHQTRNVLPGNQLEK